MWNEKIIYIIVICGVLGISLGFVIPAIVSERTLPEMEQVLPAVSPDVTPLHSTDLTLLISARGNICEECHMSGKVTAPQAYMIKDHIEGGDYCLECHTISHETHPVGGNITCQDCHSNANPTIPTPGGGTSLCGNCHAYPDAHVPSKGNLVVIHMPRGVTCVSCHLECEKCHEQALEGNKWSKRLNHFNTLPKTYK
jgi:hypothetical protein